MLAESFCIQSLQSGWMVTFQNQSVDEEEQRKAASHFDQVACTVDDWALELERTEFSEKPVRQL